MKNIFFAGMLSLSFFSSSSFANTTKPIICDASMGRYDEDPRDGYFRLQFEPAHVARIKMPDEEEQVVTRPFDIHQFSKADILRDRVLAYVAQLLHIDENQVKTAAAYRFYDSHGRYILLLSFFGESNNELGSGGFVDLRRFLLANEQHSESSPRPLLFGGG